MPVCVFKKKVWRILSIIYYLEKTVFHFTEAETSVTTPDHT